MSTITKRIWYAMDRTFPDMPLALASALLSQDTRLIEIDLPAAGLGDPLVVERFTGHEAVCADFRFDIDCLSTSAFIEPLAMVGQVVSLRLRQADGSHRHWHGHCTRVAPLGSDGGLARYRLTMEPWTAFLRLRRNALVFQSLDALGVIERILDHYPQAALKVEASQALPVRPITTQYRESDHAFVFRLLADAGLAWRFEHVQGDLGEGAAGCTLVVFDRAVEVPEATPPVLRFHRSDITEAQDAINHFTEQRQVTANAFATASWQPEQVEAVSASLAGKAAGPHLPTLEVYTVPRSGRFAARADAEQTAELRLDALRLPQRLHAGAGSGRGLAPGQAFTLTRHPDLSGERFLPLAVEHVAANNLGSGIVELLDHADLERGSYRNRFVAVPADTAIVPLPRPRPTAPGAQTARVVGLPDAAVTSTRDHQVRIQFPWQRGVAPNPGGLTDTGSRADPDGHAPGDDTSGTWVRVAEWQAGPNWGSHALPRIGSEVLVEFLHGDIDQPVITGQLYNGEIAPPFALADASNHPGTLSGLHSRSLDGSGTQQWVLDDAPGQLRQRLHTSLADSRLELGYLIDHRDGSRGGLRGQGFDLATLGWANLRAGEGVLLSTTARPRAASTQFDIAEAVGQLKGAERTAQALSDAAEGSQVAPLAANERQTDLVRQVDPGQDGKYTGAVNGQSATKPDGKQRDGGDPVEKFAAPLLFAESPDAIALATPASAIAYAGGNTHLTAQQDAHLAAGQTFAGVSGGHVALFAQKGPLKAIAANGPLSLQAHAGTLELLADQSVTVTATDERIDVLARQKIVLQAGQTEIVLEGGNITFKCPGNFTVKAGQVPFKGGASGAAGLEMLPDGKAETQPVKHWIALDYRDADLDLPMAGAEYEIHFKDGSLLSGTLDAQGKARHDDVPDKSVDKVIYKSRPPEVEEPYPPLEDLLAS
jgi:type VI secretion system secreted protein VgrG